MMRISSIDDNMHDSDARMVHCTVTSTRGLLQLTAAAAFRLRLAASGQQTGDKPRPRPTFPLSVGLSPSPLRSASRGTSMVISK